jgi:spore coat polysaccharide biosynthesis protein SpsF
MPNRATKMRTVIINQARMSSTRLPGKVLKEVLGRPLLDYQVERLRRVSLADELVIATTTNDADDMLVEFCRKRNIAVFRGSEEDVLSRYYQAAIEHQAELVVRVTSDCPVIDPKVVDRVVTAFLERRDYVDYVSNTQVRTFPRGMDTEVFTFDALRMAHAEATLDYQREHVTPFLYRQPDRFRVEQVVLATDLSSHRWTVDTPEDFELVSRIIEALHPRNPRFGLNDIIAFLDSNPSLMEINAHVVQKVLGQ